MRWVVNAAYLVAGLLYLPVALYHALVLGKNRRGWAQRLGFVRTFDPARRRIWIHAVSLGEMNATPKLVEALQHRLPDYELVFSTTTDTGFARAVALYGRERVFRFPLDFSFVVSRVLRRVKPSLIVLVELEVWYNLVRTATRRGIPVAVVNGRLTARSARRLELLGGPVRRMFSDLAWVGAQDETIASRFVRLGARADRVEVTSSLKWDSATIADEVEGVQALRRALGIDPSRSLWVCGSTGPGEEVMILQAYQRILKRCHSMAPGDVDAATEGIADKPPLLAIVPRKPERFDEVASRIQRAGFTCLRRSDHADGTARADERARANPPSTAAVFLGDSMGELRKFYSLADVVFVGRSLVPMGGSDPMEVAALGKPMVCGPHMDNFRSAVEALVAADAVRIVPSPDALAPVIRELLRDHAIASGLGARARQVVIQNQGATVRTAGKVVQLLETAALPSGPSARPHGQTPESTMPTVDLPRTTHDAEVR